MASLRTRQLECRNFHLGAASSTTSTLRTHDYPNINSLARHVRQSHVVNLPCTAQLPADLLALATTESPFPKPWPLPSLPRETAETRWIAQWRARRKVQRPKEDVAKLEATPLLRWTPGLVVASLTQDDAARNPPQGQIRFHQCVDPKKRPLRKMWGSWWYNKAPIGK